MAGLPDPGEFMKRRPVLQIAWFVFVGVVTTTVGVVSEFYPGQGQVIGGIVFILVGIGSFMAAYYRHLMRQIDLNERRSDPPDEVDG